jgi:flagellar biosynthesis/type III secretory pathway protein FliH
MSSLERWSVFIKCFADQSRRELLGEIERVEEGIAMAAQVVQGFTENELEYFREMSLHKMETAYWDEIAYAKDEGEAKGREIGREIGRAEGLETGRAEGLEVGRAEGLETGRAEGEAKSRQHILELLAQGVSAEELLRRLTEA